MVGMIDSPLVWNVTRLFDFAQKAAHKPVMWIVDRVVRHRGLIQRLLRWDCSVSLPRVAIHYQNTDVAVVSRYDGLVLEYALPREAGNEVRYEKMPGASDDEVTAFATLMCPIEALSSGACLNVCAPVPYNTY